MDSRTGGFCAGYVNHFLPCGALLRNGAGGDVLSQTGGMLRNARFVESNRMVVRTNEEAVEPNGGAIERP